MKVVFDTNVLIAAFATQGLCHAVFELCIDQHQIIISEHIVNEAKASIEKKLKVPVNIAKAFTQYLRENTTVVGDVTRLRHKVCRDPSDDWILALAEHIGADYLITGDQDLLILKTYANTAIIQPRQFWEILRTTKRPG